MIGRLSASGKIGVALVAIVLLVAFGGPLVAPYSASASVARPFSAPSREHWLGTDSLGRDVWSRVLLGGHGLVLLATTATAIALVVGTSIGMAAAWFRGWADTALSRLIDTMLAIPSVLLIGLLAIGIGQGRTAILLASALLLTPDLVRTVRAATLQLVQSDYAEAAVIRGESSAAILRRELLPNLLPLIAADAGLRLLGAASLVASATFLGFGMQPPTADWALMVQENRSGFTLQPWAVLAPTVLLAVFCLGVCLAGDAIAHRTNASAGAGGAR